MNRSKVAAGGALVAAMAYLAGRMFGPPAAESSRPPLPSPASPPPSAVPVFPSRLSGYSDRSGGKSGVRIKRGSVEVSDGSAVYRVAPTTAMPVSLIPSDDPHVLNVWEREESARDTPDLLSMRQARTPDYSAQPSATPLMRIVLSHGNVSVRNTTKKPYGDTLLPSREHLRNYLENEADRFGGFTVIMLPATPESPDTQETMEFIEDVALAIKRRNPDFSVSVEYERPTVRTSPSRGDDFGPLSDVREEMDPGNAYVLTAAERGAEKAGVRVLTVRKAWRDSSGVHAECDAETPSGEAQRWVFGMSPSGIPSARVVPGGRKDSSRKYDATPSGIAEARQ